MDETVLIGGPLPVDSYLNIDHVLRAAEEARVDAVHPGYGFLSENPAFATRCAEAGFVLLAAPPRARTHLGVKSIGQYVGDGESVVRGTAVRLLDQSLFEGRGQASACGRAFAF